MNKTWQLQEAKNRFSELVNEALQHGPQVITRHGEEAVVVISISDYKNKILPKKSLHTILRNFPKGKELDLSRDKTTKSRNVDL